MQFEGLQGLLKKKKQQQSANAAAGPSAAATTSAAPPVTMSSSGSKSAVGATDPYTAAVQKAQQQQEKRVVHSAGDDVHAGRKRSREPSVVATEDHPDSDTNSGEERPVDVATTVAETATTGAAADMTPAKVLKTAEEIHAEQQRGVDVLQECRTTLAHYWAKVQLQSTGATPLDPSSGHPAFSPLPMSVEKYLVAQFVSDKRVGAATGEPEMALLDREWELLSALHDEVMLEGARRTEVEKRTEEKTLDASPTTSADCSSAVDVELRKLDATVRVLWYLIALRWQYSLDPHQRTLPRHANTKAAAVAFAPGPLPDQQGWSPYVYLALQGALPPDVRLTAGRAVAQEVDRWRALTRTRQFALELLAYLYSDYRTMKSAPKSATVAAASKGCIVPADLRDNFYAMLVQHLQHDRNYVAVRQDYVDVTMGTANWKMGLFSGGEVHMRRSMERVERNRIHHLLNNEHATHLLQSVREVTTFAEQQKALLMESGFFFPHTTAAQRQTGK
ncbi:hypothetical protein ABB37_00086 [Leptomonas pyrrhocoris]|uniref:Pre-mRNA-splicing factor 18 n=1 Tax=Leptomonas pyrrhocoris TaxID=157538 RepID=A0A0M9GA15_LEPPY|nr:hypothetical protein ABB37_00086 [Leptomonas pyrrhocoris]KPA85716.1 hypothetical protein ABB37_00086 [Leptomonas pyrrhocoris]|eukprot:XP_015664155.1 hypothetical protein ABB37_00086 [Leptomonas pyrrhocoris]